MASNEDSRVPSGSQNRRQVTRQVLSPQSGVGGEGVAWRSKSLKSIGNFETVTGMDILQAKEI